MDSTLSTLKLQKVIEAARKLVSAWEIDSSSSIWDGEIAELSDALEASPTEQVTPVSVDPLASGGGLNNAIRSAINRHSAENGSNTPDWILADFLTTVLDRFDNAVNHRDNWYGVNLRPGVSGSNSADLLGDDSDLVESEASTVSKVGTWVAETVWQCGCKVSNTACHNDAEFVACFACGYTRPPEPEGEWTSDKVFETRAEKSPLETKIDALIEKVAHIEQGIGRIEGVDSPDYVEDAFDIRTDWEKETDEQLEHLRGCIYDLSSRLSKLESQPVCTGCCKGGDGNGEGSANADQAASPSEQEVPGSGDSRLPKVDVGEGFRRLGDNEIIQASDQYNFSEWSHKRDFHDYWCDAGFDVGSPVSAYATGANHLLVYRRKLPASTVMEDSETGIGLSVSAPVSESEAIVWKGQLRSCRGKTNEATFALEREISNPPIWHATEYWISDQEPLTFAPASTVTDDLGVQK